ncbi:hypothetical protein TNCV_4793091 [Trichonephila clavipes]|nr:hypothetical protein TNCV_4793091 [Trichonephila clavipes]
MIDLEAKITEFTEAVVSTHRHASQPILSKSHKLAYQAQKSPSLWEAQRFLKNKRSHIPTLNCTSGMAVTDPQRANLLANTINNNFIETNCMNDNYDQDDEVVASAVNDFLCTPPSTPIEPALPDEIIIFIKNTNSRKTHGKVSITNKMLKNFPIKLILILTILVNKIL